MRVRSHLLRIAAVGLIIVCAAPGPAASAADAPLNNGLIAGGGTFIRAIDSDGRSSHTLVPVDASESAVPRIVSPAWSPDGTQLAFELNGDIAVTDFRGGGLRRITASEGVFDREPAWSPDGSQIAFVRDGQVWVVGADGAGEHQVTMVCCNGSPTWSPEGTQLAFESDRSGVWQIHSVGLTAGEPSVQLTESAGPNRWPDWSPDGSSIAFTSLRPDRLADVWVMGSDGSSELVVTTRQTWSSHPAWSPDGRQILYSEGGVARTVRPDGTADRFVGAPGPEPDWQPLPACTITGTEEFEALDGTPGDDVICGLGGNDAIRGGPGDDILLGGPGEDTLMFDQVFSGVQVNLQTTSAVGEGQDFVLLNEHVRGSHGGDVLQGNEAANFLRGDAGDDLVDGGRGPDRLEGGMGEDTVGFWATGAATVDLSTGVARQDLTLDDLSLFENVLGSRGSDRLIGDSDSNVLDGGSGGGDSFEGRGGADTMVAGLHGGLVDYSRATTGVAVDLAAGTASGAGRDTLVNITSVVGSHHDDRLSGPASSLYGMGGDDVLAPTSPELVQLFGGDGVDTLLLRGLPTPVTLDLHDFLTPRGHQAISIPSFERAVGTEFADVLIGNAGPNVLRGRAGADQVFGGRGRDTVAGNRGADDLRGGGGTDSLQARDARSDQVDGGRQIDQCEVDRQDVVRRCP